LKIDCDWYADYCRNIKYPEGILCLDEKVTRGILISNDMRKIRFDNNDTTRDVSEILKVCEASITKFENMIIGKISISMLIKFIVYYGEVVDIDDYDVFLGHCIKSKVSKYQDLFDEFYDIYQKEGCRQICFDLLKRYEIKLNYEELINIYKLT